MSKKAGKGLKKNVFCLTGSALALLIVLEGSAQQTRTAPSGPQSEITVYAKTQEKTKDRYFLVGDVEIHYRDIKLFADRVELDPETKDVLAEGHVTVQLPRESVSAERLFFNLDTGLGKMEKADGMLQPTIFYRADVIDKKQDNLYVLKKAWITSCSQPRPRWDFSMSRANLKKDDHVEMWNAVFRIKKIPLFYLPYMRYPINKDRATGFLMPRIGWSATKGFNYCQGFYWAIGRSVDATFTLDSYSARGLGGGVQGRYLFGKGTGGEINLYYFRFRRPASGSRPADASIIRFKHNQTLPLGFNFVANVDLQSSFDFLREFDDNFGRAVTTNRRSEVYLQRSWSHFNLSARVSRFETYFSGLDSKGSIINKGTPEVSFNMFKAKLLGPVFFSFASSFNKWEYGWSKDYAGGKQRKSGNLSFSPTLSVPFTKIPWLAANASVTANFIEYLKTYEPNSTQPVGDPLFTKNYVFVIDLTGPVVSKIYRNKQSEPVFKHSIEPFVKYTYDSPIKQAGRIITKSGLYYRSHQLDYGITNRLYIRKDAMPREILQMTLGQTYYFLPDAGPLSRFTVNHKHPRFSEISGSLRYYPVAKFSLDVSSRFNPYYNKISNLMLSATVGSPKDNLFMSLSWYKSANIWNLDVVAGSAYDRQQVSGRGGFKLPSLSLELTGEIDYNIERRKLLYAAAAATYHYQCLDFTFEVRVLYFRLKPETQIKFSLGLGSIGKTTDFLGGYEY